MPVCVCKRSSSGKIGTCHGVDPLALEPPTPTLKIVVASGFSNNEVEGVNLQVEGTLVGAITKQPSGRSLCHSSRAASGAEYVLSTARP